MKWRIKTASLFVVLTLILVAVGLAVGLLLHSYFPDGVQLGGVRLDAIWIGLAVMFALSMALNLYAYFGCKRAAIRANKARIVTEAEEPRLYGIVRKIAGKAGIPMPEVGVSELPMPNAFATGRGPKNAAVVATRSLMDLLPDDELEAVMAHEIAHVRNRDILVMSVVSTMAAVLTYLAIAARFLIYGNNRNAYAFIIAIVLSITVPIAALLVRMAVSRNREYLADETGAKITGNPRALARALKSIEAGVTSSRNDYSKTGYADMWISNPIRKKNFFGTAFSTHPPMDDRIEKLNDLAMKMGASGQVDPFKR